MGGGLIADRLLREGPESGIELEEEPDVLT